MSIIVYSSPEKLVSETPILGVRVKIVCLVSYTECSNPVFRLTKK